MKITNIRTHIVFQELDQPFGMSQWDWSSRSSCLVEIETDNGFVGWGECFGPADASRALIDNVYSKLLIGEDPRHGVELWQRLYNVNREWGRKGISIAAISGIDIALMDLAGKALGVPVYMLLGGKPRAFPCYASAFYYGGPWKDDTAAEAEHLRRAGFRAVKMKVGADLKTDIERVRRVRASLGSDIALAIDANRGYTASEAITLIEAVSDLDLWFFEEPVIPEDLQAYQEVRRRSPIPIAGGESEFTRWGFRELIEGRHVDILQPDATACGGIRETLLIAGMASAHGIPTMPHVWGSAITLAAALHIFAALPTVVPSRGRTDPFVELDQAPNALREELSDLKISPIMSTPTGPGLGININHDVIARFTR